MSRIVPRLARLRTRPSLSEYQEIETRLRSLHWNLLDDSISAYPAKQLYATLQSMIDPTARFMNDNMESLNKRFCKGKVVPYGYSMIYCNPISGENELGFDGFDNYHAPCSADKDYFYRRMWVAGGFQFNPDRPLKFGDEVRFTETVDKMRQYKRLEQIGVDYKRDYKVDNVCPLQSYLWLSVRKLSLDNSFWAIDGSADAPLLAAAQSKCHSTFTKVQNHQPIICQRKNQPVH
ncbi:hypothetical protein KL919_004964 [Ogataea angusta]|nr:hypothetical protein KL919_004964 [Ogataea angusta]